MSEKSICVFDLDGTLDLKDSKLSAEIYRLSKLGVIFVTATGRTNSYVQETCKKYNIMPPRYIIADNGGSIYDNTTKQYIKRTTLPIDTRRALLEEYMRAGGKIGNVRYTDGDNVYVVESVDVRKYYEEEESIEYRTEEELLEAMLAEDGDITKITLAGSKELMKSMSSFTRDRGIKCWTDIGDTKFPTREKNNYRLDVTDGETCKGEALEFLLDHTGISRFTCIGNGENDVSMFKVALDSNMPIIIVRNYENRKITRESEKLIDKISRYAEEIGRLDNVIVESFPINGYIGRVEERKNAKQRREQFVDTIKAKKTYDVRTNSKVKQVGIRKTQHKGQAR